MLDPEKSAIGQSSSLDTNTTKDTDNAQVVSMNHYINSE